MHQGLCQDEEIVLVTKLVTSKEQDESSTLSTLLTVSCCVPPLQFLPTNGNEMFLVRKLPHLDGKGVFSESEQPWRCAAR